MYQMLSNKNLHVPNVVKQKFAVLIQWWSQNYVPNVVKQKLALVNPIVEPKPIEDNE